MFILVNLKTKTNMYNLFTQQAMNIILIAQEEAKFLQQNQVGTQHLFLALVEQKKSDVRKILRSCGVRLNNTRAKVKKIIPTRSSRSSFLKPEPRMILPLSSKTKELLQFTAETAKEAGHTCVVPAHILFCLLNQDRNMALTVI